MRAVRRSIGKEKKKELILKILINLGQLKKEKKKINTRNINKPRPTSGIKLHTT